ncbi:hypothetical protein BGZ61DRAFT_427876 [Ilyonectria robusta]|uniref:uncharacterized protein n=1 Tax=Ilyonectria robusta TaxID=1079257 RepID=UPI001E8CC77B|nr:uncharacterized protein BGZ61DRAFT_427876 [Ilyonectria robusta]KAH8673187.1 hypothetical protein BGZ61DRAFT_427876 [Ilyonectria robusta]
MAELDPELYTVAWLAPLEIEARAALHLLDNRHEGRFPMGRGDDYVFQAGDVCGHNIIIATLPAGQEYGTGSAAALASQVKRFFPNLWFGLLVGVAAGLPNLSRDPPLDIRLGDVLVGIPEGNSAGLIAYDLGKETGQDCLQLLRLGHVLATTETVVRSAIGSIKLKAPKDAEMFLPYYEHIKDKEHPNGTFIDPGQEKDALYQVDDGVTERLVERERRLDSKRTRVWYGPIGSGEKLMKNARKRNELRDKYNIIGLEMEAAGTMNRIPVGVIRGVCDYGDEHKNKEWQPYAAAMAAAYAKAVLAEIPPKSVVRREGPIIENSYDAVAIGVDGKAKRRLDEHALCVRDGKPKRHRYEDDNQSLQTLPHRVQAAPGSLDEEEKRVLMDSLRFDQIDARHEGIKKAHTKTCKWLLVKPEYIDWLDPEKLGDHHGFLWIKGKPGAGKSTLMKFALNNAQMKMKNRIIIAFFFNARGEQLEKSTIGMYRSLLLQLLERLPELQRVFDSLGLVTWNGSSQQWSVDSLKALFEQAVQGLGTSSLVCFIDALDECDEHQIRDMISFFEHVSELTTSAGIAFQVCFSSRHYPHITVSKGLGLVLEGQEGHEQDIVSYLDNELKIGHSKLAERIRADLKEKASGVFMWVVLVVGILQQEYDDGRKHTLRQRLRDIPGDLHELFRDILTRDHRNRDELLLCIQWVLFARQPLKPEQLYFAVLSGVDPEAVSGWDPDEIEEPDIKRFILSSSKGLAEVTRSKKAPTVQFIHESVRDFLLKENGLKEIWSDLGGNFQGESHERLKQCCIGYMGIGFADLNIGISLPKASSQEAEEARQSRDRAFPFLEYAVQNVLYHADAAEGGGVSQKTFLQTFQVADWITHDNLFERFEVRRHTPEASLLYILAEHNLANLIGIHSNNLSCFQVEVERYGPPILAALATGGHEAVLALLRAQAEAEPETSLLHGLCEQYYSDGKKQAALGREFKFPRQRTLLSYLAECGQEIILAFVLASGNYNADLELKDEEGRTPLSYAAEKWREAVVRLLLDRGAQIEAADKDGLTPLLYAVHQGDKAIIQLLLDRGAYIEAADKNGRTPLLYAAAFGLKHVVQLLLGWGAQIDVTDNNGQTPLLHAAVHGNGAVVQLLLGWGAQIEAADKDGRTPLSYAVHKGHDIIVRLLQLHGAKSSSTTSA